MANDGPFLDCGILPEGESEAEAVTGGLEQGGAPNGLQGESAAIPATAAVSAVAAPATRPRRSAASTESVDLILPTRGARWPAPDLPGAHKFRGLVTYVDDEGQLYVQTEEQADSMGKINSELSDLYEGGGSGGAASPAGMDRYWSLGELCVARYPGAAAVTGWYRGVVTDVGQTVVAAAGGDGRAKEVLEDSVKVLFVDYGERKVLYPGKGELVKRVPRPLLEVPIQLLRCKLDNVVPVGAYPKDFLDDLHRSLVDKWVDVEIKRKKDADSFPLPVFIHYRMDEEEGHRNLARDFVEQGVCRKIRSRREWYDPEAAERQEEVAYRIQPIERRLGRK